jgi:hypothetical protein
MMGRRASGQDRLFYAFNLEELRTSRTIFLRGIDPLPGPSASLHQSPRQALQPHRPPFHRSGADDPDADRRLLLRYPLRAPAVRGGAPEPGLPLVLPARSRRCGARPLDLLQEPPWPLPRQRHAFDWLFDDGRCERCLAEGLVKRRRIRQSTPASSRLLMPTGSAACPGTDASWTRRSPALSTRAGARVPAGTGCRRGTVKQVLPKNISLTDPAGDAGPPRQADRRSTPTRPTT